MLAGERLPSSLHDGPHERRRSRDSFRVGRGHGDGVGPEGGAGAGDRPFDAIEKPGGSPVAVKVRVCAGLESTADIANEAAVPLGLL